MSLSTAASKVGSNQPRFSGHSGHGVAYDPYYGDMLDTIQYGSVDESIQLFSRKGYDVNLEVEYLFDDRKKYNVTPLYWAVRHRKPKLCKFLLEQGARPFNNLVFEYYPLHEACNRGYGDVLKVFIEAKVDLNKTTPDSDTPLHIASMRGHIECVHLLLKAGADTSICNKAGRTPVQEALYQHQDDLIQLFQVFGDPRDSSQSKQQQQQEGHRRERRLSLGSRRASLRHQESSPPTVPCRRPRSVLYDQPPHLLSASTQPFLPATTRSHSHQNLALSPAVPSVSTAPPPHCVGGSLSAAASDHLYTTPAKISYSSYSGGGGGGSSGSSVCQPPLVSQLSIASSCAADSPSPVERDGVGRTLLPHNSTTSCCSSSLPASKVSTSSTTVEYNATTAASDRLNTASPTKHVTRADAPYSSTSHNQYSGTGSFTATSSNMVKDATPTVYVDSGRPHPHPRTHLPVTSSGGSSLSSKLQHRLMGSNSNPEFPILQEIPQHMNPEKRAMSSSSLYERTVKSSVAPVDAQAISPSREKLNTLSHHVYSSFDENINQPATSLGYLTIYNGPNSLSADRGSSDPGTSHPMFSIVQKILHEMAQKLNVTPEHTQSLINSIYSNDLSLSLPPAEQSSNKARPHSLSDVPTCIGIEPSAENLLAEMNVEVSEKPLEVKFGVPAAGFVTVLYQATRKRSSPMHSGMKQMEASHILKVIVRVFNLKNWTESSQYHSLAPPPTTTSTCGLPSNFSSSFEQLSLSRPLQEVACLHKLSHVLHPNIAPMVTHFKATTSDQHIMLARNFDAENLQALYTAAPNSDYLLVRTSTLTLAKHFENLRKKHYGIIPEASVLATLAQLNLGIAHLVKNQISHCSINPDDIYIDDKDGNRLLLANFSQSIEFSTDLCTMEEVRSNLRLQLRSKGNNLRLCPEVFQWLQETDTDYCYVQHDAKTLFITNDSYSGARMIYSLLLGESHESVQQLDAVARSQVDCTSRLSTTTYLPRISSLSPQCNHLLQKLVSPNISKRLRPIEAAVASLVLLFGPRPSQVQSIEDCHQWLLAEAMQFYMRPVLNDSSDSDTSELYSRLLYMYLTIADKAPCLVWKFCSLFKSLSV